MSFELHELTDEALIELCRERGERDDRPFSELFGRHHRAVWSVCRRNFSSDSDADDLTQEVFLKAFLGLSRFEGRAKFSSWVHRIALNVCMNERRRRKSRPQEDERSLVGESEERPGDAESTVDRLSREDELTILERALGAMDEGEKEILELVELQDLPVKEVAERLGIGVSAAKMRALRARAALRQEVNRILEEAAR